MAEKLKEFLVSEIAKRFYLWLLTLCFTIIAIIFIMHGENSGLLADKIIGGLCLTPLATAMLVILRRKGDKTELEGKIKLKQMHYEEKEKIRQYKLEKYRIKYGKE